MPGAGRHDSTRRLLKFNVGDKFTTFADMELFESGMLHRLHSILYLCTSEPWCLVYFGMAQVASATRHAFLHDGGPWRPEGSRSSEPPSLKGRCVQGAGQASCILSITLLVLITGSSISEGTPPVLDS